MQSERGFLFMFEDLDKKCCRSTVCSKILSGTGTSQRKGTGYEQALGFIWDSSLCVACASNAGASTLKMIAKKKLLSPYTRVYNFVYECSSFISHSSCRKDL